MSVRSDVIVRVLTAAAALGSIAHVSVLFPRYLITDPSVPLRIRLLVGTLTLTVAAALGACLLALTLVARSWRQSGARALALFLAGVATFWGSLLRLLDVSATGSTLNFSVRTNYALEGLIVSAGVLLATAAFLRFSALFPVPLDAATLPPPRRLRVLRRVRMALLRPRPVWIATAAMLLVVNGAARVVPPLIGGVGGETLPTDGQKLGLIALALFILVSLVVVPISAMLLGLRNLVSGYRAAGPADRRRVLWLVAGVLIAVWMLVLPLIVIPVLEALQVRTSWMMFASALLWFLAPAVLVVAAAIAVFYSGAVDPRLVLRRSTVVAILGGLAFIVFTTLESLLSGWFESALHLPGLLGSIAAGVVSALLLVPVRGALGRVARNLFRDEQQPVRPELATAVPSITQEVS